MISAVTRLKIMNPNPYAASSEVTETAKNPLAAAPQPDLMRRLATSSCYALGCIVGLHGAIAHLQGLAHVSVLLNEPLKIFLGSVGFAAIAVFSSAIAGWLWSTFLLSYNQFLVVRFLVGCMFSIVFVFSHFPVARYLMDNVNWITDVLAGTRLDASTSVIAFIFAMVLSQTVEAGVSRSICPAQPSRRIRFKAL